MQSRRGASGRITTPTPPPPPPPLPPPPPPPPNTTLTSFTIINKFNNEIRPSREMKEEKVVVDIDSLLYNNDNNNSSSLDASLSPPTRPLQQQKQHINVETTASSQPLLFRDGSVSYPADKHDDDGTRAYTAIVAPQDSSTQHATRGGTSHLLRSVYNTSGYVRAGFQWTVKILALGLYALLLLPGFVQIGYYYFFSPRVQRNIAYGEGRRNRLDLYIPEMSNKQNPAVVFVTGGAWIIGYKAWGALLAQELVERDVIVACIDYRNYPQSCVSGMVEDISKGIGFFCNNIHKYGGDPERLYLVGQSAGAHLAACALIEQAKKEAAQEIPSLPWMPSQLKAFIGISGGYNLPALMSHFHSRGFYRSLFLRVMEGEESLLKYSPELVIRSPDFQNAAHILPATVLFHGMADYSIPFTASANFADALRSINVPVSLKLYEDKTHTDMILQDPMRGGKDQLLEDILAVVHANDREAQEKDAAAPPRRRLVPQCSLQLARKVSPF